MAKILEYFEDINFMYNNCSMHDTLAKMLSEFESEIRAKAQREIVEWCFDNKVDFDVLERYADKERVVDCVLKHFVAEQLKERE